MKYLICCVIAFSTAITLYSQKVYKYQLSGVEVVMKDRDGEYLCHTRWVDCNILVSWDLHAHIVTVKAPDTTTTFTILGAQEPYLDADSNLIMKMRCIDDEKKNFGWRIINLVTPMEGWHDFMKLEYGGFAIVYRMKELE